MSTAPTRAPASASDIGTAAHRGASDFEADQHLNPYDFETEGDLFRAWIDGYRSRKAIDDLFGGS